MALSYMKKKHGGVYYGQIAVPSDLQITIGAKMKERSLRTKDAATAKAALPDLIKEWLQLFDDARRGITRAIEPRRHTLTNGQMASRLYRSDLAFDAELRGTDHRFASMDVDPDDARRFRDGFAGKLSNNELHEIIGDRVEHFRLDGHHDYEIGSEKWRTLAQSLCAARYESMTREDERSSGNFAGKPDHPILVNVEPEEAPTADGEGILELFQIYERENPRSITADTFNQARRDIGTFIDSVGGACSVGRIDKKAVRNWKALLMQYPVKATETKAFAGMTIIEIVKENEEQKKPVLSPRTVNRYLSSLGAFCTWLVTQGYLDANPVDGMSLAKDKKKKVFPFTVEQMNTLFTSPLFTGCQSADEWRLIAKPGNVLIRDHRYWVPLVMLYSGARPAEIAQLSISDVRQDHDHWIMHVTEEGEDDKSVKTAGSMRVLPIHPDLVKLGFIDYFTKKKDAGATKLFPEAVRNSRGQMIAEFSREFGRYLTRLGMKSGRGLSLYSFRHGATDALRRAGHLDEQFGFILGHTSGTMTGRYGNLPQGMLEQRVNLISSIAYPELVLDHLI